MLKIDRRLRRNRASAAIRRLVRETVLVPSDLICPFFIQEGANRQDAIKSMPGVFRWSLDLLLFEIENLLELGITSIMLFPVIDASKKDAFGSYSLDPQNILCKGIQDIKRRFPEVCVIGDIALDPYTNHGHDGILNGDTGEILNDETVCILGQMSELLAETGVDIVAPSDMMDGRVQHIRAKLDQVGFSSVGIMSYSAKYASAFYSPFRDALQSHPTLSDKKTYQMSPENLREALLESLLDEKEGADILMVKPAGYYLDVLYALRRESNLPLAAYQVSGEYAMIALAAEKGFLDMEKCFYETLVSIKRAGADMIISYAAPLVAKFLKGEK